MKSPGYACLCLLLILSACNNSTDKKKQPAAGKDTVKAKKADPPPSELNIRKPPIVNIIDTVSPKRIVIYMKDSAANSERVGLKLAQVYGIKLAPVFKKNKGLKMTGQPMAWYRSQKAPFFFEAGVPVNKRPAKLAPGVMVREMPADSVTMAHFFGPYDMTGQGYDAIRERLKDTRRTAKGRPYEIYISDPVDKKGKPVDPYRVQTDIVFPRN